MKDYYNILEVSEEASEEVIHMAYKGLVKKYHPDARGENADYEEKMKEINEAYSVLSNPEARRAYDRKRKSVKQKKDQNPKEKPAWYCSMLVLIAGLFICFPVSIVLTLVRIFKYKNQGKGYRIRGYAFLALYAVMAVSVIGVGISDARWESSYNAAISQENYAEAYQMLDDKYRSDITEDGVIQYFRLFQVSGDYSRAGRIISQYYDGMKNKSGFSFDVESRIRESWSNFSKDDRANIEKMIENVELARAEEKEKIKERENTAGTKSKIETEETAASEASRTTENEKSFPMMEDEKNGETESNIPVSEKNGEEAIKKAVRDAYILPDSDKQVMEYRDVENFTEDEMLLAADEIYARHGVIFENKYRDNYFRQRSWYSPKTAQYDFNESELNEIEKENIQFLEDMGNGRIERPSELPAERITINICTEYKLSLTEKGKKAIKMYVDDRLMGEIGANQNFTYDVFVDAGEHILKVKYGNGEDSISFDTDLKKEYRYICKYESFGVKIEEGWDDHYLEADETYMVSAGKKQDASTNFSDESDYIDYIRNGKTPTFDKNCKIGYLLESIMTNSAWECLMDGNYAQVIYTGDYNSMKVEVIFEFNDEVKPVRCQVGENVCGNSLDILETFSDFEKDYLKELEEHPYLSKYYKRLVKDPEKTLMDQDYILPDSDRKYYTTAELDALSMEELRYARNEIYAKHGLIFEDWDLKNYFLQKSWYNGSNSIKYFDDSCFNEYERANLQLIIEMEKGQ